LRRVTTENQPLLAEVLARTTHCNYPSNLQCIGQEVDGEIIAVIGYSNFLPKACEIHVGSICGNWATKDLLWAAFDYPFNKLEVKVILGQVCGDNKEAIRLNRHLGFEIVAEIPDAHQFGDLVIMAMKREQCRWLNINCDLRKLKGV